MQTSKTGDNNLRRNDHYHNIRSKNTVQTTDDQNMERAVEREPNEKRKAIFTGPTITTRQALIR